MCEISLLEFADKMNEVMPVVLREFARRQADELYKGKIPIQQFLILEFLHREGESKMTRLAQVMKVTTAAMTGIVERLVRDGYCLRLNEPNDRRIIKIELTQRGADLVKKISQQRRRMLIKIFGKISEPDRKDYLRILMQIRDILLE